MKRDMDLVRELLIAMESIPGGFAPANLQVAGYTDEQVKYHAHIMEQAGLITAIQVAAMGSDSPQAIPQCITWAGHEFIDTAREPLRWNQAKKAVEKVGGVSISVWTAVLTDIVMTNLGMKPGM